MPQIKQYESEIRSPGPIDTQRATPEDFGAGVGEAISNLGQSTFDYGTVLKNRAAQQDLSDLDSSVAKAKDRLGLQYQDQLQKGTLNHDDFLKNVDAEMDAIGQNVNTREGQFRFNQLEAQTKLSFSQEVQRGQSEIAGDKAKQNFLEAADARSSFVMGNPLRFQQALAEQNQSIDDMVATKGLMSTAAPGLKRVGMDKLAMGAIRGMIDGPGVTNDDGSKTNGPELAQKELDSGKWDNYFGEGSKYKLQVEAEHGIHAKALDAERQQKLQDKAAAAVQEATAQSFLTAMHDPNGPGLSAMDVLKSMQAGKIDSATSEHFLKAIAAENQEKKIKSDPAIFNDLTQRLALPDGDPKKITDIQEINSHLGKDISIPDANLLYGLLAERHTPQGDADAAVQKSYFESTRTQLVKKNALGMEDPEGMKLYQDVQAQAYQYSLDAAKRGKSKQQIWSPIIGGKPNEDYVGNHVLTPQRSMQDIMKSTAEIMKRSASAPSDTTEMELPNGRRMFVPNKNVDEAVKRGAKKRVK